MSKKRSKIYQVSGYAYPYRMRVFDLQALTSFEPCNSSKWWDDLEALPVITPEEEARFHAGIREDGTTAEGTVEVRDNYSGSTKRVPRVQVPPEMAAQVRNSARLLRGLGFGDAQVAQMEASIEG